MTRFPIIKPWGSGCSYPCFLLPSPLLIGPSLLPLLPCLATDFEVKDGLLPRLLEIHPDSRGVLIDDLRSSQVTELERKH